MKPLKKNSNGDEGPGDVDSNFTTTFDKSFHYFITPISSFREQGNKTCSNLQIFFFLRGENKEKKGKKDKIPKAPERTLISRK